ncbi:uncharacterized protein LOC143284499 [Babylonia areolata]|uniref:uncharacterized protein LOC143284499 n=1 Tax=Babylonia areolata TaxID=304850 RepID=UPI003FD43606
MGGHITEGKLLLLLSPLTLGSKGPMACSVHLCWCLCLLLLLWGPPSAAASDKCSPFPRGEMDHNVTSSDVTNVSVIQYEFRLDLSLSTSVSRAAVSATATSLKFCHNDSRQSVTWELLASNGTTFDRTSPQLTYTEKTHEGSHELALKEIGGQNFTLHGTICMKISDTAGAGDLLQSVLRVTVTHADNRTCTTFVHSPYFYLPPPRMWVGSDTPQPVPMMGRLNTVVNLRLSPPASRLTLSRVQVRTPSEESSREVILTIQTTDIDHVTGFTAASKDDVLSSEANIRSTYSSYQNDVGEVLFPPLRRDDANFTTSDLAVLFAARAEDYSQLSNDDVVNVSAAVTFGDVGGGGEVGWDGESMPVGGGSGANLIWVSSLPVTLQAPPLELKQPDLELSISQKSACAYDGETRSKVEVKVVHTDNSTATAYNVTARVYLTAAMTLVRHVNSELRQNSLSLQQLGSVVNVDIERMTFSDPTTVTLDLDVDLSDPRARLARHHVITADAVFSDRWGNSTGMFTAIDYVSLKLDKFCSRRLNWTSSDASCTCSHDVSREDCACCQHGACQCGDVNPAMCQPCDSLHLCQPYLDGFDAITQLDAGDGQTVFICAPYHLYRAWSKGISCYRRTSTGSDYSWAAVNPMVSAIMSRDTNTGQLYGISNNGLAHVISDDNGVTWFTVHPDYYRSQLASGNVENATLSYGPPEM